IKPAPTRTAATKIAAARITKRVAEDGRSEPAGAGLEGASKADASVVFGVAWPTTSPACTSKSVAVGSGKAEPTTGAMKRYPRRGMVSTKRGFSDASPSTSRSRMTALFSPWSKSTKVSPGQSRLRNSSRVTISPGFSSSTTRTWKGCSGSLIRSPCLRSSESFRSSSKTPKCKILATVAGLPMGQGGSISPLARQVKVGEREPYLSCFQRQAQGCRNVSDWTHRALHSIRRFCRIATCGASAKNTEKQPQSRPVRLCSSRWWTPIAPSRERLMNRGHFASPWHETGYRRNSQSEGTMLISEGSRKRQRFGATLLLVLALGLILTVPDQAQEAGGTILGAVTDPSGASVSDAKVVIKNMGTGVERSIATNADGLFVAPNLVPGSYQVRVEAAGFSSVVESGVVLTVGENRQ